MPTSSCRSWVRACGSTIRQVAEKGQRLVSVMRIAGGVDDKVEAELPAPASGTLQEIRVPRDRPFPSRR